MVATPSSNLGFQNFFQATLTADITASSVDIPLDNIPNSTEGFLVIDPDSSSGREVIFYDSKTALKVVCPSAADGRGQDDTTASAHSSGTTVIMAPVAGFFEALQSGAAFPAGIPIRSVNAIDWDGWVDPDDTWTYASASTFTVPGDVTSKYSAGTRLKFTQTTQKYGTVATSSHAAGTTTVTIIVNTDYVLANAAITSPFYSYAANPQGYPQYFNWSPTWTNLTVGSAAVTARFSCTNGWIDFNLKIKLSGSTVGTQPTFTLPVNGQAGVGDDEGYYISANVRLLDAGTQQVFGMCKFEAGSVVKAQIHLSNAASTNTQLGNITSTTPWTWANNDCMFIIGSYPMA